MEVKNFSLTFEQPLLQMTIKNGFQSSILWQLKIFSYQPMVIKNNLVTPFYGDQKISVATKGGNVTCFWKTLNP
jgi:hypothetical protein